MQYVENLRSTMLLGKYPNEYINLCCTYADNLLNNNFPVIFDKNHLQKILNTQNLKVDAYTTFYVKGRNKTRTITAPSRKLKIRQRWILENILEKTPISDYAHGFVKGRSIVTNAEIHLSQKYMLNMDIEDFFPSIMQEIIVSIFKQFGYTEEVASELTKLCCFCGALPQGAVTSPYLSNLVCRSLDAELSEYANNLSCKYSRYADDITISGSIPLTFAVKDITSILNKYSFKVNNAKTRIIGERQVKRVTGLIVSDRVRVPKDFKRELRKELYYCKKMGAFRHLENINASRIVNYQEHLYGKIYYVKMIEPELGQKFLKDAHDIIWT